MKFIVYGVTHVGVYLEVEAGSKEEANKKAEEAVLPRLCHQCNSEGGHEGTWGLSDGIGDEVEIHTNETESR
jgi:hypothetical protein